jgi:hypothetical protein
MNVVFLSPHFPPGMYLGVQRLRAAGATVLAIADVPYDWPWWRQMLPLYLERLGV